VTLYNIAHADGTHIGQYRAQTPTDAWLAMLAELPAMRGADADNYAVWADRDELSDFED
jgi:hypothetical protein